MPFTLNQSLHDDRVIIPDLIGSFVRELPVFFRRVKMEHIDLIGVLMKPLDEMSHTELAEDLATIKTMALSEVPLGAMRRNHNQTPRADVLSVKPRYGDFVVTIYEVKRTRSDLLGDLRDEKWKAYLPHCHRIYFACKQGICSKREIPKGVGLCLRNDNGWYTLETPRFVDQEIPLETMKAIMFQRVKQEQSQRRRKHIYNTHHYARRLKYLGKEIKDALIFYRRYRSIIDDLRERGVI